MNARELRAERAALLDSMLVMCNVAESANRELNSIEQRKFSQFEKKADDLMQEINRLEGRTQYFQKPSILGDEQSRALCSYIRSKNTDALRDTDQYHLTDGFEAEIKLPSVSEQRATANVMAVVDATGGGPSVPNGFSRQIAARKNEILLPAKLGCLPVPGQGTTVNFPYENGDPAVFASTSEQVDAYTNTYEEDRPVLANKAFTLVKYSKKVPLSEELIEDEDANLMEFIADHIGRAVAKTQNQLLLTEVAANGSVLKTFASATVIAVDELETIAFGNTIAPYLDDERSCSWVMQRAVHGEIVLLDDASTRRYASNTMGQEKGPNLLGFPISYSVSAGATVASAASVYFGNWRYVGWREGPSLRLLRDPYTTDGIVYLKFMFRCVFGVLVAGAIGYARHPSA